jgi:hypothetical protein
VLVNSEPVTLSASPTGQSYNRTKLVSSSRRSSWQHFVADSGGVGKKIIIGQCPVVQDAAKCYGGILREKEIVRKQRNICMLASEIPQEASMALLGENNDAETLKI